MEIKITVERHRSSATQGEADVLINGIKVMSFGDEIQLIKPGEEYYGPIIGNWASKTPNSAFVIGMLYHQHDNLYHYSDRVKKVLERIKEQEEREAPVFTELQRVANKNGWPMRIKARGEVAHLVDVQPLCGGEIAPIYRFPGGDNVVSDDELIPYIEDQEE